VNEKMREVTHKSMIGILIDIGMNPNSMGILNTHSTISIMALKLHQVESTEFSLGNSKLYLPNEIGANEYNFLHDRIV